MEESNYMDIQANIWRIQEVAMMRKHRISYRVPWWQYVNWDVALEWGCWLLLGIAIGAIITVILVGSFLRQMFG